MKQVNVKRPLTLALLAVELLFSVARTVQQTVSTASQTRRWAESLKQQADRLSELVSNLRFAQ